MESEMVMINGNVLSKQWQGKSIRYKQDEINSFDHRVRFDRVDASIFRFRYPYDQESDAFVILEDDSIWLTIPGKPDHRIKLKKQIELTSRSWQRRTSPLIRFLWTVHGRCARVQTLSLRKSETMKTTAITVTALLMFVGALLGNDKAVDASKTHLNAFLRADYKKLEDTYASKVVLMPGHEFLKVEYGFTTEPGRKQAIEVERAKLIQAMTKASEGQPARPADKIVALMESLRFEVIKTTPGDFATQSSDPVGTPDSKLHFTIKEGDVLVKAAPPKGDFILLQVRQAEGEWRVVGEYLD